MLACTLSCFSIDFHVFQLFEYIHIINGACCIPAYRGRNRNHFVLHIERSWVSAWTTEDPPRHQSWEHLAQLRGTCQACGLWCSGPANRKFVPIESRIWLCTKIFGSDNDRGEPKFHVILGLGCLTVEGTDNHWVVICNLIFSSYFTCWMDRCTIPHQNIWNERLYLVFFHNNEPAYMHDALCVYMYHVY